MSMLFRPAASTVLFGSGGTSRELVGRTGTEMARLAALGLATAPGFTLTTEAWRGYAGDRTIPSPVWADLVDRIAELTASAERSGPVELVVRGSAPVYVPGIREAQRSVVLDAVAVRWFGARHGAEGGGDAPDAGAPPAVHAFYAAVLAAWDVWSADVAVRFRSRNEVPDDLGIAVTVHVLARSDQDPWSGVGVVYSRDPISGAPRAEGTFRSGDGQLMPLAAMRALQPDALLEIDGALPLIEADVCDMCEVDFVVARGQPWFLRARPGQRSATAAIRIAVGLADDGLISIEEALHRVPLSAIDQLQQQSGDDVALDGLRLIGREVAPVASPDLEIAQMLQWADERSRVEIVAQPRAEATILTRPEQVPGRVAGPVDVRVLPDDHCGTQLERTVWALEAAGATDLGLLLPPSAELDGVRPPAGRWRALVADRNRWSTRLLAGRLDVVRDD